MEWISCKERLPENKTEEYLTWKDGKISVELWVYRDGQGYWYDYLGITHWTEIEHPKQ